MGTAPFAVPALAALHEADYNIAAVVTQPDRARGRGGKVLPTPVGAFAEEMGLTLLKPESLAPGGDFLSFITEVAPDLIVVAAYGKLLPKALLELPPLGCVNIHASLLPEYRGAAPIQRAVLDGNAVTGVTLMYMAEGLDTGDMIAAAKIDAAEMSAGELTEELAKLGAALLIETLPMVAQGTAPRVIQDETKATYAGKIEKAEGRIDLGRSAEEAVRRVRAMTPAPGAYVLKDGERMGVVKARALRPEECDRPEWAYGAAPPGKTLAVSNRGIYVRTGDGVLLIEELKMPGKKAMPAVEYLKGNAFDTNTLLE